MKNVLVKLNNYSYPITFINHISELRGFDMLFSKYKKAIIISDDVVSPLYLKKVIKCLETYNLGLFSFSFKHGEESKNIKTAMRIVNYMILNGFHRNDLVVALGGGVVGDLSGFVASIYMRGIDFIQIPTTLLAAVDASIGGKTGVDIKSGKNLVGTFHQPKAVIEILEIFRRLPQFLLHEGASEIIKYGAIYDRSILDLMTSGLEENIEEIVFRCAKAKAEIVSQDEKESGLRKILNFGHTFAHSIEQCSKYTISHGKAVAYGMLFESFIGFKKGVCPEAIFSNLKRMIGRLYLLDNLSFSHRQIIHFMKSDKKNNNSNILFVVPTDKSWKMIELEEYEILEYLKHFSFRCL